MEKQEWSPRDLGGKLKHWIAPSDGKGRIFDKEGKLIGYRDLSGNRRHWMLKGIRSRK